MFPVLAFPCTAQTTPEPPVSTVHLRITHGPILENVTATSAVIAWSTNINAGTVLHYGTSPDQLNQAAGMPWGGLTHRVELHGLQPGSRYFFQAESPHGQGTGENAQASVMSFLTRTPGETQ